MLNEESQYEDLMGRPFNAESWHCWSCVREIYARGGIVLPAYPYSDSTLTRDGMAHGAMGLFRRLDGPQPWAIVAISHINQIIHTGVVLPDCIHFLHVREQQGTVINKLSQFKHCIEGFYAWQG
jgi:hypothetical protein